MEQLGRVCALDNMYRGVSPSRRLREYWIFSGFLASDCPSECCTDEGSDAVPLDLRGPPVAAISVLNASSWPRAIRLVDKTGKLADLDEPVVTASTAGRS